MATSAAAAGTSTSTSTSSSSSQSNYVSGQLKNNVQSRLDYLSDVFLSLSELVAKYDAENRAMKDFIAILLHFKYMLQFLRANLLRDEELFRRLGPDAAILFKADLKQCLAKFNAAAASSPSGLDFVHEKTDYYRAVGTTAYCSYVEDDTVAPVMPPAKRGRFGGGGGGGGEVYSAYRSANHSSSSFATAAHESTFSSDRASNASDSEHLEIKVEPDVEIIEPPLHHLRGGGGGGFDANLSGELSDDSSRAAVGSNNNPNSHNHNSMLTAMLDKPITNASSSSSMQVHHRLTRDRNNDLKVTLRKVAKRSMVATQGGGGGYSEEDAQQTPPSTSANTASNSNSDKPSSSSSSSGGGSSNNNINNSSKSTDNGAIHISNSNSSQRELLYQRKPRTAKNSAQNYAAFERGHSREAEEDYDFDYEKEDYLFGDEEEEEEEGVYQEQDEMGPRASYNAAGQLRCPQSGCGLCFDAEDDLSEHLKVAHFTNVDFNTFCCLVVGCTERFPNSARATVHMKNVHPEEYITCEQCQKQVKAHYMRKHFYMRHRRGTYKCSQDCDYVAAYYHELEKHRYMTHNNRYNWVDNGGGGGGGGGGSAPVSMANNSSNVFFPTNPIAAAIMASHNNSHNSNHSNSSNGGGSSFNAHLDDHPHQSSSVGNLRQPTTTTARRYLCKYPDSNCSYWHESRSRVLQHIRTLHLSGAGGSSSTSGRPTSSSSSSSSSNKNGAGGGSLVLEDRAAEYLEVYDFPENSFYD